MVRENAKRTSSGINIYLLDRDIVIKCLEQEGGRTKREEKRGTKRDCDVGILFGAHSKRYHGLQLYLRGGGEGQWDHVSTIGVVPSRQKPRAAYPTADNAQSSPARRHLSPSGCGYLVRMRIAAQNFGAWRSVNVIVLLRLYSQVSFILGSYSLYSGEDTSSTLPAGCLRLVYWCSLIRVKIRVVLSSEYGMEKDGTSGQRGFVHRVSS